MAKPISLQAQLKEVNFQPDQCLIVQFVTSKYDSVWKKNDENEIV